MSDFTLQIGERKYTVEEPTFEKVDALKDALGFDITGGMTGEQGKKILEDMKQASKIVAIILTEVVDGGEPAPFSMERVAADAEYFYKNGKPSDFKKALSFFGQALQAGLSGGSAAVNSGATSKTPSKKKD